MFSTTIPKHECFYFNILTDIKLNHNACFKWGCIRTKKDRHFGACILQRCKFSTSFNCCHHFQRDFKNNICSQCKKGENLSGLCFEQLVEVNPGENSRAAESRMHRRRVGLVQRQLPSYCLNVLPPTSPRKLLQRPPRNMALSFVANH